MSVFKNKPFAVLLAFLLLLLDGRLSLLLRILFHNQFIISSHLLILLFLFYTIIFNPYFVFILAFLLGIIYDFYYLGIYNFGIMTLLFPLIAVVMIKIWKHVSSERPLSRFLVFFILLFFLDFTSIAIAYFYQLTAYPLNDFITYNLAPSLIFNTLAFLLLQKLLEKIYLERRR